VYSLLFTTIILLAAVSATPMIIYNSFIILISVIISVRIRENLFTNSHQNYLHD